MNNTNKDIIVNNLTMLADELSDQHINDESKIFGLLSYVEEINQIKEYIDVAGEYAIAYESIVALLETYEVVMSGKAAVALLELGLIFKYKMSD